jgi:WD40 repeat protein
VPCTAWRSAAKCFSRAPKTPPFAPGAGRESKCAWKMVYSSSSLLRYCLPDLSCSCFSPSSPPPPSLDVSLLFDVSSCFSALQHSHPLFHIQLRRCIHTLTGHAGPILCLSGEDSRLASGSGDTSIKIWDISTHQCVRTLEGHSGKFTLEDSFSLPLFITCLCIFPVLWFPLLGVFGIFSLCLR